MLSLKECNSVKDWNSFLAKEEESQMVTLAHNPCMGKILNKTFGYDHQNYFVMQGDKVVGAFPTCTIGRKLVSMPHFSYGGPIFNEELNTKEPFDLKSILGNVKFEVRSFSKQSAHYTDKKVSCILELKDNEDDMMMTLKSKLRQKIRKCLKQDFIVKTGGLEFLDDFYMVFSRRMLKFGSPPLGRKFFKDLLENYENGDAQITVIYDGDKAISSGFSLSYLGFNELCWSGTEEAYGNLNVNAMLFWEMIKTGIDKGYKWYSFGRSTIGSSQHSYKKFWNPMELPVYYNLSEEPSGSIKDLEFLTRLWKYQPLKTSQVFGHLVSKYVY